MLSQSAGGEATDTATKKGRFEAAPSKRPVCGKPQLELRVPLRVKLGCPLATLLFVLGRREERRQGIGGSVIRVPEVGQAKGGFNGFQQRIMRLKARVLNPAHTIVRNGDEHHFIIEVSRSVAVGARE